MEIELFLILIFLFLKTILLAEDKITSSPLINIDKIKPSFEEFIDENESISSNQNLKDKKIIPSQIISGDCDRSR